MRKSLETFCRENGAEVLLEQWDPVRNAHMTPETISYGSKQKIWWKCSKDHIWQAPPYARTGSETGCPYCAGKLPVVGESDLKTRYPMVAAQWHHRSRRGLPSKMATSASLPGSREPTRCSMPSRRAGSF